MFLPLNGPRRAVGAVGAVGAVPQGGHGRHGQCLSVCPGTEFVLSFLRCHHILILNRRWKQDETRKH